MAARLIDSTAFEQQGVALSRSGYGQYLLALLRDDSVR